MGAKKGRISTGQPGGVGEVAAGPGTPSRRSEDLTVSTPALSGPTLHWAGEGYPGWAGSHCCHRALTAGTGTPGWTSALAGP